MSDGLETVRAAAPGRRAWLVGGAVRDRLLGRGTGDLDVVVDGDPRELAAAVAQASGGAACFALSEDFATWRVVPRNGSWQLDVEPLRGGTLEEDLALRDFTINAIAEPLAGGEPIDPLGGLADLAARLLRMAAPSAFAEDPLRVLRLVRMAVELGFEPEAGTLARARASASAIAEVSPERVFMELRRIVDSAAVRRGLALMDDLGATAVVLPELEAMRGMEQNRYHHLDVHGHTLEVLDRVVELTAAGGAKDAATGPAEAAIAPLGEAVRELLAEPLADGLSRGGALRWGALLHDAAKPLTRERHLGGRLTFIGHDVRGAELASEVLGRLRASARLRSHVAALVRHHLRLGFLVHEPQPLSRRTLFAYIRACEPVEVDVTLLSIADRLATRGDRAAEAIDAHVRMSEVVLAEALRWRAAGPPPPLLRGDELARELALTPGPSLGDLLERLLAAQYAGEIRDREQAIAYARELLPTIQSPG